ncbi:MAG TPA: hypothetical protein VL443_24260 [Cyclobacteriaceae bacterium]|jgi:hypothetical protein|nr:hypothetical protein [Cyclobacteriaceae bacterium]
MAYKTENKTMCICIKCGKPIQYDQEDGYWDSKETDENSTLWTPMCEDKKFHEPTLHVRGDKGYYYMKKEIIPRTISIDFDSTCVLNEWPQVGESIEHCVDVLKRLNKAGHTLILVTMRANNLLDDAEEWFRNNDIEIKYSNCNPEYETGSRKIYSHLILDDKSIGVPLINNPEIHKKPFVDWVKVEKILEEKGYL